MSLAFATPADARVVIVRPGDSIQAAVDQARPGDTVLILPGLYTGEPEAEYAVGVTESHIKIVGLPGAILDATSNEYGIMVGEDAPIVPEGCPPITVWGFQLRGLTIRNAEDTGVRLVGVEDFKLTHSHYLDNEEYGPFPICSNNGIVNHNFASGHRDAAIYVGDSNFVSVRHNVVTDSVVGVEIENSTNCDVKHNVLYGNAGGALIFVGPNLPQPFTDVVEFSHNLVVQNNRINDGGGAVGGVPEGSGLLIFGSDNVTVRHNVMLGNNGFGLAAIGNPNAFLDPRLEPFNDNLLVEKNVLLGNGLEPDPIRQAFPGADIIYVPDVFNPADGMILAVDPDISDNCFEKNVFQTVFTNREGLPTCD